MTALGRIFRAARRNAPLFFLAVSGAAPAATTSVPVIGRDLFLAEPEITGAQISPDGRYLAFLKTGAARSVWLKRTDQQMSSARFVSTIDEHSPNTLFWSRDSRYLLFTTDASGHGQSDLFAVDVNGIAKEGGAPEPSNLTNGHGTPAQVLELPEASPGLVYVALTDASSADRSIYDVEIATGKRHLLRKNDVRASEWVFDLAGKPRLATRTGQYGSFEVMRLDPEGPALIYSCSWSETCIPLQFDPDGWHVYIASNRGENTDLIRLISLDVRTGNEQVVASDPARQVDLDSTVFSPRTRRPAATVYKGNAGIRYAWTDRQMQAEFLRIRSHLPHKDLRLQVAGEQAWMVFASADREPGEAYLFDRRTGSLALQYRLHPSLPRSALAQTKVIHYASGDGLEIHAYLTLPNGVTPHSLPLVVLPHEGPWNVRDEWGYSDLPQFLANRGYAVLQPNFRGSLGFGKRFLAAGDREWGGRMQEDITEGVRPLIASGVADSKRIAIFGLSYGGFAALAGAAFTPDLYAAAIAMSGPSDLKSLMKSVMSNLPGARVLFVQSVGDPSTPEGQAQLERQSPINAVNRVRAPILVIQGALDPLSPPSQSDQIVAALRARNSPVTYLLAQDEGHVMGPGRIWAHAMNNQAVLAAVETFLSNNIGGLRQIDIPPEVAQRLGELNVPLTVRDP